MWPYKRPNLTTLVLCDVVAVTKWMYHKFYLLSSYLLVVMAVNLISTSQHATVFNTIEFCFIGLYAKNFKHELKIGFIYICFYFFSLDVGWGFPK